MRERGFSLVDLVVFLIIIAVVASFLLPSNLHGHRRGDSVKCGNNLKQIGLAANQYADDRRFFPHVGKIAVLDGGFDSDTAARCVRSLSFYNYDDNPETFVCPSSVDMPKPFDEEVRKDIRSFCWTGGAAPTDRTASPLYAEGTKAGDRNLADMTDLSYGWTKQGLSHNSVATNILAADKSRLIADDEPHPRHKDNAVGNHKDCLIAVKVDGGTQRLTPSSDKVTSQNAAATTQGAGGFLGVLEDDEKNTD